MEFSMTRRESGSAWNVIVVFLGMSFAACGGGDDAGLPTGPPVVETLSVTSAYRSGATLNGNVIPNGLPANAWFEWGTSPTLDNSTETPRQSVGSGTASIPFNAALDRIYTGTTYYFRAAASNSISTSRGAINSFVAGTSPIAETGAVRIVPEVMVGLFGNAVPNGLPTKIWFEWGTSPTLEGCAATPEQDIGDGWGAVAVSAVIDRFTSTGLVYYYRLVAQNNTETVKGDIANFTY